MTSGPSAPLGERVTPGTADQHLLNYLASKNFERVFLVTGHRSFSRFEDRKFIARLSNFADTERWSDARPNPEFSNLKQGLEVLSRHDPNVIIGIGGGSVLDMAKLLAVLHDRESTEVDAVTTGAVDLSTRKVHLILVPTTAGSGAEATHFSVLYRDATKYSISGEGLLPDHIVLDPSLVTSGEPAQLAASGLDALCQCVESIWAKGATKQSQESAIEGLRVLSRSLVGFVKGDNSFASEIQWGSHLGGHAINTSKTTAPHALAYFLTIRLGVAHGVAVASTLGYFIEHHSTSAEQNDSSTRNFNVALEIIREVLGLGDGESAVEHFKALFSELGLDEPRTYWPQDNDSISEWLSSANPQRLGNHPLPLGQAELIQILGLD